MLDKAVGELRPALLEKAQRLPGDLCLLHHELTGFEDLSYDLGYLFA